VYIIIPSTVQQYWITNATTGSFNFYVRVSAARRRWCSRAPRASTTATGRTSSSPRTTTSLSTPVTILQGGTGSTTASGARLNLGITTFADAIVTATTGASVRSTIGAAASGTNGDITSLTGLTTALSAPQGGTGQSSYAVGDLLYASSTTALSKLADVATGSALLSGGVGVAPAWVRSA
jgi:hypothetical protein